MPTEKQQSERLEHMSRILYLLSSTQGTLSYNDSRGMWFYSIPGKWSRARTGEGFTPEQAIDNACKQ